jgi:hypothetical protein
MSGVRSKLSLRASSSGSSQRISQNTPSLSPGVDSQAVDIFYESGGFDRRGRYHNRDGEIPGAISRAAEEKPSAKKIEKGTKRPLSQEEVKNEDDNQPEQKRARLDDVEKAKHKPVIVREVDWLKSQLAEKDKELERSKAAIAAKDAQIEALMAQISALTFENSMLKNDREKLKAESPKKNEYTAKEKPPLGKTGGWQLSSSAQSHQARKH